jgi:hypothetical protein
VKTTRMNCARRWYLVAALHLAFSSCATVPTPVPATIALSTSGPTTPSSLPPRATPKAALIPTVVATHTQTPTPSPTASPTFAGPAECPDVGPGTSLPTDFNSSELTNAMLSYLNSGGTAVDLGTSLASSVRESEGASEPVRADLTLIDLTQDGVRELLWELEVPGDPWQESLLVFGCGAHEYRILLQVSPLPQYWIDNMALGDLNADGKTELAYRQGPDRNDHAWGTHEFNIVAWDGGQFQQLIQSSDPAAPHAAFGGSELHPVSRFEDLDGDGVRELLVYFGVGSGYSECGMYPSRATTAIWRWDGEHYVLEREDPEPPKYRYQAVEDGDRLTALGFLEEAIVSYQRAVSDRNLKTGTPQYWRIADQPNYCQLGPLPTPGAEEGPRLEAYAMYRLMLARVALGQSEAAEAAYNALRDRFPVGQPGHPYAEMAETFWLRLQASADLAVACDIAVIFAAAHADQILDPFGYGSDQQPEDLCPFHSPPP